MKHIKIFEEFTHSQSEGNELFSKYSQALTEKAGSIKVVTRNEGEVLDIKPNVKIFGDNRNLQVNNERSINVVLDIKDRNRDVISFDLYYTDETTRSFVVYKPSGYTIDADGIYQIVKIYEDAGIYVGGLTEATITTIERTLTSELLKGGEPNFNYVRAVVKV